MICSLATQLCGLSIRARYKTWVYSTMLPHSAVNGDCSRLIQGLIIFQRA